MSAEGKSECNSSAGATKSWTKYDASSERYQRTCPPGDPEDTYCYEYDFTFVDIEAVCSTGDKCYNSKCSNPDFRLRGGSCTCGSVGAYKVCCKLEGGVYTPVAASKYGTQDDRDPEEGACRGDGVKTLYCRDQPGGVCRCPAPAPSEELAVSLTANPTSIESGESSTLSWTTTNATGCTLTSSGSVGTSGSVSVSPAITTTYTLACAKSGDPTTRLSDTATVSVIDAECGLSLVASPSTIACGSATLSWSADLADNCAITGIGSVPTSGSRQINPDETTTYTFTCARESGGGTCSKSTIVTVDSPLNSIADLNSVSASLSATRSCLPYHPNGNNPTPEETRTTLNWSGSVSNKCGDIIGGGTPSNYDISCGSSGGGWNFSRSGSSSISGSQTVSPDVTQTYSVSCTRSSYTCSNSRNFSGDGANNDNDCDAALNQIRAQYGANIEASSCSRGACDVRWNSSTDPEGNNCELWSECPEGSDDPTCPPCRRYACRYYEYDLSVRSKEVCSSTDSASQTVRVIQEPRVTRFETEPSKAQILFNQLVNIVWSALKPDSGTPTTLRCTPSVTSGDGTGWTGTLDSLNTSGTKENLSPAFTTIYRLICRNRDNTDPVCCYKDSDPAEYEVKVFTPELEEVNANKGGFAELLGQIREGIKRIFD